MTDEQAQAHRTGPQSRFHGVDDEEAVINLRQLMLSLWYHKLIIILTTLLGLGLAYTYVNITAPVYQSTAQIIISANDVDMQSIDVRALITGGRTGNAAVQNEVAILQSRSQLKKLARHLGLYRIRDMSNFSMDDMPDISTGRDLNQFKSLDLAPRRDGQNNGVAGQPGDAVIDRLGQNLKVRNISGAAVIEISYSASNPDLAAAIPQTLAKLYIKQTLMRKTRASRRLRDWLNQRLSELRKKLREVEQNIADFQRKNEFFIDDRNNIVLNRLVKTNTQIIETRAALSRKRLQLKQARKILNTDSTQASAVTPQEDGTLNALKKQERSLLNKKAEAMTRYGPKHPEIKAITAELESVRSEIRKAARAYVTRLENEVELLTSERKEHKNRFQTLRKRLNSKKAAVLRLKKLERKANSTQKIYESFLKKYKRAINTQQLKQPDAELISDATVSDKPVSPKKGVILALAGIAGIVGGAMIVVLTVMLKTGFYSQNELERAGLDTLGIVPLLKRRERRRREDSILQEKIRTPIAEALRNIYLNLRLRGHYRDRPIHVLAVTSTLSGEGKTSAAGWLAQTAARSGASVCVVDGDMRKPGLHRFFQLDTERALVDYLGNHAELDDIIQHSQTTGVDVITGRSAPNALSDLLSGDKIRDLIAVLRQRYDFVIIDTPALLAVPDARFITRHADHIAYLVAWNTTGRDMLERGLNTLKDIPGAYISAILSMVNIRHQTRRGYSDMLYYYSDQ